MKNSLAARMRNDDRDWKIFSALNGLPKAARRRLLSQIMRLCEKQYRKGVQQGVYAGMDKDAADQFRFQGSLQGYRKHACLGVFKGRTMKKAEYLRKLSAECWMGDMGALADFLAQGYECPPSDNAKPEEAAKTQGL